jgi:hypothetical protein
MPAWVRMNKTKIRKLMDGRKERTNFKGYRRE